MIPLGACGEEQQAQGQSAAPPPAVTVFMVKKQDVTPSATFNGRIEAVDTVELRARVEGFVEQRLFTEGAEVKTGDLLIEIEKAPYEAEIGQIQGQITSAEGTLRLAKLEVDRQKTLVQREAVAKVKLDEAEAQYAQALGSLQQLQAALRRKELDLSYTDILAPIDGRIGRSNYSVGDFVTPSNEPLAVIVSQDPVYVSFPISSRELLEVRKAAQASGRDPSAVKVKLRLPDGSIYDSTGTVNFVDVQVDSTTDTVTIRASVPNPVSTGSTRLLVANQLVGVIVEQAQPEEALVIPQAAIVVDQAGPYVVVVDQDSKAEQRRIRLGSAHGSAIVVAEGLQEGEQVIVDGLQKVRPGQTVTASAATDAGA
ncbi:MAG: efflux RND transporter periplasmic adaptor subunit [Kiloniellales bacterium]